MGICRVSSGEQTQKREVEAEASAQGGQSSLASGDRQATCTAVWARPCESGAWGPQREGHPHSRCWELSGLKVHRYITQRMKATMHTQIQTSS